MRRPLEDVLKGLEIPYRTGVPGAEISSFRIGGPIKLLIEPCCRRELIEAICLCLDAGVRYALIGAATNLLFDDGEIDTVLIRTVKLDAVRISRGQIYAECGARLPYLAMRAASEGLGGLCFACGIPGTLGGALFMNAGAHGEEISRLIERAEIFLPDERKIVAMSGDELGFSYRNSALQHAGIVALSATLRLEAGADPAELKQKIKLLHEIRRMTQPIDQPSAGSVFRRPSPDVAPARLIDELGLKGRRVGGAQISHKHAGFIVNIGGATASDVRTLIKDIQKILEREKGIVPEIEIRFIPSDE